MNQSKKTLKAFVLSMAMASLLSLPLTMNAQNGGGMFGLGNKGAEQEENSGMMRGGYRGGEGIGLGDAENENPTPVGSGMAILTAIGAGYALLKRKEDKQ